VKISLNCSQCGQNRFAFPLNGDDHSPVLCEECGRELGMLGQLKERVAQAVFEQSDRDRRRHRPDDNLYTDPLQTRS
jgi:hypothetical protein